MEISSEALRKKKTTNLPQNPFQQTKFFRDISVKEIISELAHLSLKTFYIK